MSSPKIPVNVLDTKKNDDAAQDMAAIAERLDRLTAIMQASAQGHFRRSLVAL